jgi:hypothetical protein
MQNHSPLYPWSEQSFLRGIFKLISEEGIQSLGLGLQATLLRECIYSTIRMGAYEPILTCLNSQHHEYPSPSLKYLASLISGGIGAAIANPTDLIKIKFQASRPSQPLPYRTTFQGFQYIIQRDGFFGLWKGSHPTIARAAVVTSTVMGSYDSIKNNLLKRYFHFQDGIQLQFICSLLAGVITTLASNPSPLPSPPRSSLMHAVVDVVKTKYMCDVSHLYRSPWDCVMKTYQEGGVAAFYRVIFFSCPCPVV